MPVWCQAITWANADPVHRCIFVALGGDELTHWSLVMLTDLNHHWFNYCIIVCLVTSHHLNLIWLIPNWTLGSGYGFTNSGGRFNIMILSYQYNDSHYKDKTGFILKQGPGGWFNIKMSSCQYMKSHCGDKTVVRSSYLHNGISYTGKMTFLYWIRAQVTRINQVTNTYMYTSWPPSLNELTHWGRDKMAAVFQTTFSTVFS